jgi:hypothetical protein
VSDRANRDGILGGDTPFLSPSDAWHYLGPDHRAFRIEIDGKEATRSVQVYCCAAMLLMYREDEPDEAKVAEVMIGFVAGANHDLVALGLHPLISMQEVERLASHPQVVAAVGKSRRRPAP